MRLSTFTLFFIVICTVWASQGPIETLGNETVVVSKRDDEPPTYYEYDLYPAPPYKASAERNFKEMEKLWEKRSKYQLAPGLFKLLYVAGEPPEYVHSVIRRRDVRNVEDMALFQREVKYLSTFNQLDGWAISTTRKFIIGKESRIAYITMPDMQYRSGRATRLQPGQLEILRKEAQQSYSKYHLNVGTDENDYVYEYAPRNKFSFKAVFV